jgi:hypothetical protein
MKQNRQTVMDFLLDQKELLLTKDQVEATGLLNSPPYSYAAKIYMALNRGSLDNIYVPHSDVHYVRAAIEKRTGYYFPLDTVEQAMRLDGWKDRRNSWRY